MKIELTRDESKAVSEQIGDLVAVCHANACCHGWWDDAQRTPDGAIVMTPDEILAKLALIHSELGEATEEVRKGTALNGYLGKHDKPEGFVVEIADVLIRCFDLAGALGLELGDAIVAKHAYNVTRDYRHGGKRV